MLREKGDTFQMIGPESWGWYSVERQSCPALCNDLRYAETPLENWLKATTEAWFFHLLYTLFHK